MKRNGTTYANRTRWRCKTCGASTTIRGPDTVNSVAFAAFIAQLTIGVSLRTAAAEAGWVASLSVV